jgi:hypothetical protein
MDDLQNSFFGLLQGVRKVFTAVTPLRVSLLKSQYNNQNFVVTWSDQQSLFIFWMGLNVTNIRND